MKIYHMKEDITNLVMYFRWSGARNQSARSLELTIVQDSRDKNVPSLKIENGHTIYLYDNENKLIFQGNIFSVQYDRQGSKLNVTAYDNLYILSKSKTTRKFVDITAEDITMSICNELGVKVGELAKTNIKTKFIADAKTGYQIIMMAYTEASKATKKKYQTVMNGDKLNVIEKGLLIEDLILDASYNITNTIYSESIKEMVNRIMIVDEQGNKIGYKANEDEIKKYSMIQDVYKINPKQNTDEEVQNLFKHPERTATINVLGDLRLISGYSIQIKDNNLVGKFWIKSDSHTFENGIHETRVELEFENIMNEEKVNNESEG